MKQPRFVSPEERRGYEIGFKAGYNEGMKKAAMIIQLVASSTEQFSESLVQNSQEVIELRRILTGKE